MKQMDKIRVIEELKQKPIVLPIDVSKLMGCSNRSAKIFLNRLAKSKIIYKIKGGKYSFYKNIYSLATNLYHPSYLSFWSASAYKGYTEQIVNTLYVVTTKKQRKINFEGYKIKFIKSINKKFFGFHKEISDAGEIFVANDEKLIIDCLLNPKYSGNFDELLKIIEKSKIDPNTMVDYLDRIKNKGINQKIGFLLEKYKNIDLYNKLLISNKSYARFYKTLKETKINKKWRVKYDN